MTSDPIIRAAHQKVSQAIRAGVLTRPATCSVCGQDPGPTKNGQTQIHGHHHQGYDYPLDVQWLCVHCHRKETPLPSKPGGKSFGKNNGAARLTVEAVRQIKASPLSQLALGRMYGVHRTTIQAIKEGRTWKMV